MNRSKGLIEVYTAKGEAEAQIIRGLLESSGIPCLLKSLAAPSVHVFIGDGMGEVKIMVRESDAEKARKLIGGNEYA